MDVEFEEYKLFDEYYEPEIKSIPRKNRRQWHPSKDKKRKLWCYNNSIFRKWREDSPVSLENFSKNFF